MHLPSIDDGSRRVRPHTQTSLDVRFRRAYTSELESCDVKRCEHTLECRKRLNDALFRLVRDVRMQHARHAVAVDYNSV
jgi:hypothetical protein